MFLSDPIRFQFYGFLYVLGFFHLCLLDHPCARSLKKALVLEYTFLKPMLLTLRLTSQYWIDELWIYYQSLICFLSGDILFDSINNIYVFNPATLHLLIPWERWVHPIVHMELRWKSQVYFSHSHLSMFWKYDSVLSCISKHILSYASLSPAERCWNRVCAAVSYFLVMILPFQLQKQSGSDCGTENKTVQFLNIKVWRRQRSMDLWHLQRNKGLSSRIESHCHACTTDQQEGFIPLGCRSLNRWFL